MLRPQLMVMESSAGSCSRLLESLEATEALTFGYLLRLGAGNGRKRGQKKAILFPRGKTKPEHGVTPANAVFLEASFQAVFEAVQGAAF